MDHDKVSAPVPMLLVRNTDFKASYMYDVAKGCFSNGFAAQRVVIYPAYIDVKKTVAQGRRISKSKGEMSTL